MKNNNEKNEKKKIIALIVLIATLMISTTGATFAYFAIGTSVNNVIQGTSATVNQNLIVKKLLPDDATKPGNGIMVPQYGANGSGTKKSLQQAVEGGCVDANNNVVCQVYRISYQNGSTSNLRLNSTIQLKGATVTQNLSMSNLKWFPLAELTGQDSATPTTPTYSYPASNSNFKSSSDTTLGAAGLLNSNKWRIWYIVIWIQETGSDQYSADGAKTFTGIVNVNATDASGNVLNGITSTFTG